MPDGKTLTREKSRAQALESCPVCGKAECEDLCLVCYRHCECRVCHDLGFFTRDVPPEHPEFGQAITCDCRRDRLRQQFLEGEMAKLRHVSQLGPQYDDLSFATYRTDWTDNARHRSSLRLAFRLVRAFAQYPLWTDDRLKEIPFLTLVGPTGSGKTGLAACVYHYRQDPECQVYANSDYPPGTVFVVVPELIDWLREAHADGASGHISDRMAVLKACPMLILDDLGMERSTGFAQERIDVIINHRSNNRVPTMITTNLKPNEFPDRVRSRIMAGRIHVLNVPDYRQHIQGAAKPDNRAFVEEIVV